MDFEQFSTLQKFVRLAYIACSTGNCTLVLYHDLYVASYVLSTSDDGHQGTLVCYEVALAPIKCLLC